jgi:large repetitive protein
MNCIFLIERRIAMLRSFRISNRIVITVFLLLGAVSSFAQSYSGHNWYFGSGTQAIRFSRTNNTANLLSPKAALGSGGSAVVSDPATGNLSFYTDGVQVFDATNTAMPGGPLTGAPARNQGVVVCKVPGQTSQYYIIHADNTGTVRSSIVDMSLNGNAVTLGQPPLGQIITSNTVTALPAGQSEAMIIIPHSNGEDFWLITHTTGTTNYTVSSITAATGITPVATVSAGLIENALNFSYHAASGRIAVSPGETNRNVEILTFDNTTGAISSSQPVLNSFVSTATDQIYDTEFDNSGRYLYVSSKGVNGAPPGDVLQFDLTDPTLPGASVLPSGVHNSYGLQMGPDSAIYHLYEASAGVFRLGKIERPDTIASFARYDASAFPGNPNFNGRQFSTYAPQDSVMLNVSFTTQGTCTNSPVSFFPSVTPTADSLVWDFGDGQTSSDWSPIHTYQSGGTNPVNVTLTAFLNGDSTSTTQPLSLTNFDAQISLVQDTTACSCELPFPKHNTPVTPPPNNPCNRFTITAQINGSAPSAPSWQWFISGQPVGPAGSGTTATLQPDSAGYYYLVATAGGCSVSAGVNIAEYDLQDARANIWYFGQNAGIDFNPLPANPTQPVAKPTSNPVMNAPEGTATISDRNGLVIFFTDGQNVWDNTFTLVTPNAGGEQGSTQSSFIIQVPGDETLYYIFTTQEVYGAAGQYEVRYSIYDAKTKSVVGPSQVLFARSTERLTGNENWLIAHEFGNNSFRAYPIGATGIGNPVISSIGSMHSFAVPEQSQGYMKLGSRNILAVAVSTPGVSNVVEMFDFVDSTGVVTNFRTANLNSAAGQVYGVEVSPGGNKLFATLTGPTSRLVEFAIDSLGNPHLKQPPFAPVNAELGAIETGPDGQVYVAVNNSGSLGTIQVNEDTTQVSIFNPAGFALAGGTQSHLGLPNFAQNISTAPQTPGLSISGFCFGDTTIFNGTASSNIDTLIYNFGDGSPLVMGANLTQVTHVYPRGDTTYYPVLQIRNRCGGLVATIRDTIRIHGLPRDFTRAETLCQPPQPFDVYDPAEGFPAPPATYSYFWALTGDSTRVATISTPAYYAITVTDTITGCVRNGAITINPYIQINLGSDTTICTPATLTLNSGIGDAANLTWTSTAGPAPAPGSNGSATATISNSGYVAVVYFDPTDPSGCSATDTVQVTANPTPTLMLTGSATSSCVTPNGFLQITLGGVTSSTMNYVASGANTGFNEVGPGNIAPGGPYTIPNPPTAPNLAPDTYIVTVFDQLSSCSVSGTHIINPTGTTVAQSAPASTCPGVPVGVGVTASSPAQSYTIRDAGTGQPIAGATNVPVTPASTTFTVNLLPGNYIADVNFGNNCNGSGNLTVSALSSINVGFITSNLCTMQQVEATGGTSYDWALSDAGSLSGAGPHNTATVTINPGTWMLRVLVQDGVNCATRDSIRVTVDNVTPDFTVAGECTSNFVTLTVTQPLGNYSYRWFENGTQVGTGSSLSISSLSHAPGTFSYTVEARNISTTCSITSAAKNVVIQEPFSVVIIPDEIPCTDDQPIALRAVALPSAPTGAVYEWSFNGAVVTNQTTDVFTENRGNGTYAVRVIAGDCPAQAVDYRDAFQTPTPSIMPSTYIICPDPENPDPTTRDATLYPGIFDTYLWSPGGATTDSITVSVEGQYMVVLEDFAGCRTTDVTNVIENCIPRITGPNAFRPSSSLDANQQFRLFTVYVLDEDFEIFIFNRWGEMVFQSYDKEFRWNGGYNNNGSQLLPPGTYSYVVRYKSVYLEDGTKEHRGGVVLLR